MHQTAKWVGAALWLAIQASGGAPAGESSTSDKPHPPSSAPSSAPHADSTGRTGTRLPAQEFFWRIDLGLPLDADCYTELRSRDWKWRLFGDGRGESEFRSGGLAIEYRITPSRLEYRYIGGQDESSWQVYVRGHAPGGPVFFPRLRIEYHRPTYWLEGDELVFADADDRSALKCTYEEISLSRNECAVATDSPAYFVIFRVEHVDALGGWVVELDGGSKHGLAVGQALYGMGTGPHDYDLQVIDVKPDSAIALITERTVPARPMLGSWVANNPGASHYPTVEAILLPPQLDGSELKEVRAELDRLRAAPGEGPADR